MNTKPGTIYVERNSNYEGNAKHFGDLAKYRIDAWTANNNTLDREQMEFWVADGS